MSLKTGNDEVQSIQNQLNSLKLNPYREVKVINDEGEGGEAAATVPMADNSSSTTNVLRAKDISGQLSDIELSQTRVDQVQTGAQSTVEAMRTAGNYQQGYESSTANLQQQQQQPMTHFSAQYQLTSENIHQQQMQQHQQMHQQQQQQQQMMMNMGQQFMYAMQRSVNQVINAPHFGFEWVKPDYYFDPINEDVKPIINSQYQIKPPSDDDTESSVNSVVSDSDVLELYNALEEFSNKEGVNLQQLQS